MYRPNKQTNEKHPNNCVQPPKRDICSEVFVTAKIQIAYVKSSLLIKQLFLNYSK